MRNGRQKGGFDPTRLTDVARPVSVVPKIMDAPRDSQARGFTEIKIVGVGGAGTNAVNRMIEAGVQRVEFIAVNTDGQSLQTSQALHKVMIGGRTGRGLGAGGDALQGERAAEISAETISEMLVGADMVFLTAGMGGGTGTGAAPVIADLARREKALTVGIVTLPFSFEGRRRGQAALDGLENLRSHVDALIVIPNDRLLELADRQMSLQESFQLADDVLRHGVQGISDLVTLPGLINVDFADVRTIMQNAGTALMAIGEARGEGRAVLAARAAIASPLLDVSIAGASGVLINISGGPDITLAEVNEAAELIREAADPEANIIFGAVISPRPQEEVSITVIATGLKDGPRLAGAPGSLPQRRGMGGRSQTLGRLPQSEPVPAPAGTPYSDMRAGNAEGETTVWTTRRATNEAARRGPDSGEWERRDLSERRTYAPRESAYDRPAERVQSTRRERSAQGNERRSPPSTPDEAEGLDLPAFLRRPRR